MPFYKICVFSDVKGRVVMDGKPVVGATMRRSYLATTDQKGEDTTITDSEGRFSFASIWLFSLTAWINMGAPGAFQEITITLNGRTYSAYRLKKYGFELHSELPPNHPAAKDIASDRRKLRLLCDLSKEPNWKEPRWGENQLYGICEVVGDEQL